MISAPASPLSRRLRILSLTLLSTSIALATGCTYVTKADFEEKLPTIDEDGDKSPRKDDCDDKDPTRSPDLEEIPYDGIDNDCDGQDLVDVDGDTYPGIAQADWQPQGDVTWPPSVQTDDVDCNDDERSVFPNKASDPPYDGIDADCDCANDFDVDGDGDIPAAYEADFTAFAADSCYAGPTPTFGDCDDFDAAASSQNTTDTPYDGVDADCDGSNDFDADGDGYMPDDVDPSEFDDFIDQFFGGVVPTGWGQYGDCDDDNGNVNPGVVADTAYDGVDSDCGCNTGWDNDFDADGDGWIRPGDEAALATYAATWCADQNQPADGGTGDCDDSDLNVNPGQLEILGDANDSDCDGGADTSVLAYSNYSWTAPRPPALARTTDHYILTTAADQFTSPNGSVAEAGVALSFDDSAGPGDLPASAPIIWRGAGTTYPLGAAVDAVGSGSSFWVGSVYDLNGFSFLMVTKHNYSGISQQYERAETDVFGIAEYASLDVEIALDNASLPWAWSVGPNTLHVLHGDGLNNQTDDGASMALATDATVFIDDPGVGTGLATTCDASLCETWSFNGTALSAAGAQPWAGDAAISANGQDGLVTLVDPATGVILDDGAASYQALAGIPVHYAESAMVDGIAYIASVVDNGGSTEAWLTYGDPVADTWTDVPLDAGGLEPTGAAVYADTNRVFVAISAEDGLGNDAVGWTFFGPQ